MALTFYVYEHWRPDINVCFYVGKGSGVRAKTINRPHNSRHINVLKKLARLGVVADVRIVHSGLSSADAYRKEQELIAFWRTQHDHLTNLTDGGDGGCGRVVTESEREKRRLFRHSDASRAKMSVVQRERPPKTKEHCAKIAATLTGRKIGPMPDETKNKIRRALIGKPRRPMTEKERADHRIRMIGKGNGFFGKSHSDESIEKMRAAQTERMQSDEIRSRISKSLTGRPGHPMSDENKQKLIIANKGKPKSEETRAKLSAARKRYLEKLNIGIDL